ncbi:unnamed protein product [Arctia plantaginis]|uniref:Uncharacterized protein n=1 Tax=Arctia plantaginis TaxID=874455 RepID=A0A8S1BAT7_ARCPL|nr:unnamed protein product [Arctia plantaginis]
MADKNLMEKLANVPLAQPGFDSLGLSAPVIVQLNPEGKWSNKKPDCLEEERLKAVVQHLVNSKALTAAQSYCCQCAQENKNTLPGGQSNKNYVPVIMMPIFPSDECPFDMECELSKIKQSEAAAKTKTKAKKTADERKDSDDKDKDKSKVKKRGFVLQRLTDFDLLSQW